MTTIKDCLKQINTNSTLTSENGAIWEIYNTSLSDMNDHYDDEEEIS
jgi:hypothetical protein